MARQLSFAPLLAITAVIILTLLSRRRPSAVLSPSSVSSLEDLSTKERMELLLQEWRTVVDTQMHFNDMIIRMRTLGVTAVVTVFGAAAFAIGQYPDRFYDLLGERFHVSEGVIFFGLVLWAAIFFIDFFYYFRLLIGAVNRSYEIDDAFRNAHYMGALRPFGMSRLISDAIGPRGIAQWLILGFYIVVFGIGLSYLVAVHFIVDPPPMTGATQ